MWREWKRWRAARPSHHFSVPAGLTCATPWKVSWDLLVTHLVVFEIYCPLLSASAETSYHSIVSECLRLPARGLPCEITSAFATFTRPKERVALAMCGPVLGVPTWKAVERREGGPQEWIWMYAIVFTTRAVVRQARRYQVAYSQSEDCLRIPSISASSKTHSGDKPSTSTLIDYTLRPTCGSLDRPRPAGAVGRVVDASAELSPYLRS